MQLKLRRMDPIYRLFLTDDLKLKKLQLELRGIFRKIGLDASEGKAERNNLHDLVDICKEVFEVFEFHKDSLQQ